TKKSNTGLDLKVEDKKKPDSEELMKNTTEELIQELEKMSLIIPVLMNTNIVENIQRLSKSNKQKESP
ncbi:15845_t:CDS:1, partial [Dentiscutata heterogama]